MHVCALGLLVVGGVQVHDSTKLQIVHQELKCPARLVSEIESTDVTLRQAQGEDPNEDDQVQLSWNESEFSPIRCGPSASRDSL